MTQVFDPETGGVTPVTVIQAGPCPVVQVKFAEQDGYDAVQLAFDAVAERKLSKGELGHLAKFKVGAHRKLVEFRGGIDGAVEGEAVTVEAFEPGDKIKVAGIGIGKGFQGTIKRHNFGSGPRSHGSHNIRKPGSIGASATPSRVFKGQKMAGPHGRQARHAARPDRARHRRRAEPAPRQGRRSRPEARHRGGAWLVAAPKATLFDGNGKKSKDVTLDEGVFAAEVKPHLVHEAVRAELNAQRAGTSATKSRGLVSGGRAKPWRQKGTGRARQGTIRAPQFEGGGHAFAKVPRTYIQKVNRKAAKAALRSALASHASGGSIAVLAADDFDEPSTKLARGFVEASGLQAPVVLVASEGETGVVKSFRNLQRVAIVAPSELDVAAVVWARSLLVTESALEAVTGRAAK